MTIFARWFVPTFGYCQVATAVTVTGMPFSAPLPDGSSRNVGGDRMLVFTPGESLAIAEAVVGVELLAGEDAGLQVLGDSAYGPPRSAWHWPMPGMAR
jgi:hypothetical protein